MNQNADMLVIEDNIPMPQDNRSGEKGKLPENLKQTLASMSEGQSFFIEVDDESVKSRINALRSAIRRFQSDPKQGYHSDWLFSVRKYQYPEPDLRKGVRVYRVKLTRD